MKPAPSSLHGQFVENGYHFQSFGPVSDLEACGFLAKVGRDLDKKPLFSYSFPLGHRPIFGYDTGDIARLEAATDTVLKLLPHCDAYTSTSFAKMVADDSFAALNIICVDFACVDIDAELNTQTNN